jgi:glutaryl-CoA dehydrogenase
MKENNKRINDCIDKEDFPFFILEGFKELGLSGLFIKGYGSEELSLLDSLTVIYEISKFDCALAIFILAHFILGCNVLAILGSEEQKQRVLPLALKFEKIMAFGLTEPLKGSEAMGLDSYCKKTEGGYILNG